MLATDARKDPTHLYIERKRTSGDRHIKASQVRNTIFRKRSSGEGEANTYKQKKLPSFRTDLRLMGACVAQVRHQPVNPWLIHVNVWQKPLQYYKVISLQLIKINEKKTYSKKKINCLLTRHIYMCVCVCIYVCILPDFLFSCIDRCV